MAKTKTTKTTAEVVAPTVAPALVAEVAAPTITEAAQSPSINLTTSGCVKWFNNKAGYGFITVNDCESNEERDIFVHHSEITVDQSQYKYLVQGEYVEFILGTINRENKLEVHATGVRGINGGKLMCETRNEVRSYRASQPTRQEAERQEPARQKPPRQQVEPRREQQPRQQAEQRRPQLTPEDQTEWMVVPRRRAETVSAKSKVQPRQRRPEIEIQ